MKQYLDAVRTILTQGTRKENRTGVDTISAFNVNYSIDLRDGFPLLTTKKVSWKNIVVENLWFLSGEPDIGILQRHGCKFWDAWADAEGRVPSAYGNFWRRFPVHSVGNTLRNGKEVETRHPFFNDQIAWVLSELKRNPMSRRLVVSAWAPGNAQTSKLPPCHITMVLNVQNLHTQTTCKTCDGSGATSSCPFDPCISCDGEGFYRILKPHLCLHLTQRSCDVALGVPYNIAGYAFLLELFARFADLKPGIFGHTLVDAHAYTCKPDGSKAEYDHIPGLKEQLTREPRPLPRLQISPEIRSLADITPLLEADTETVMGHFELEGYDPHPAIKFKVAV